MPDTNSFFVRAGKDTFESVLDYAASEGGIRHIDRDTGTLIVANIGPNIVEQLKGMGAEVFEDEKFSATGATPDPAPLPRLTPKISC